MSADPTLRPIFCPHCGGEVEQSLAGAGQPVAVTTALIKLNKISLESCAGADRLGRKKAPYIKSLTLRLLMSYIYGAPILDVSRSHTTT